MRNNKNGITRGLVVGASGTIGSAVARSVAPAAESLVLHYHRNRQAVEDFCRTAALEKGRCHLLGEDLTREEGCRRLVSEAVRLMRGIDFIAICHGGVQWKHWENLVWSDWEEIFKEHCMSSFTLAKEVLEYMKEQRRGRIVYLSSISPKYAGSPKSLHYAAAKAALETAMKGLAREAAPFGVCVNGVRAGFVMTPQQTAGRNEGEIRARIEKIPLGRAGRAEEVAGAFAYLLSAEAAFVTGTIIEVAGGD